LEFLFQAWLSQTDFLLSMFVVRDPEQTLGCSVVI
jgi:hypothetical protein